LTSTLSGRSNYLRLSAGEKWNYLQPRLSNVDKEQKINRSQGLLDAKLTGGNPNVARRIPQ
jgi:hypothetical protein